MCQVVDIVDGQLVVKGMALWLGKSLNIAANMDWLQIPMASPKIPRTPRVPRGKSGTAEDAEANSEANPEANPEGENALDEQGLDGIDGVELSDDDS